MSMYDRPVATIDAVNFRGVLGARLFAYLIDLVMIFCLSGVLFVAFAILGVLTFGAAWLLIPLVFGPGAGVIYSAITVGGSQHSTLGMRMLGMRVITGSGTPPGMGLAAVHALLFYVATSTGLLLLLDLIIGLARRDRRLGHDLLTDIVVVPVR